MKNKRTTKLKKYLDRHGAQAELCRRTGLTNSTFWQMLRNNRDVKIIELPDGSLQIREDKLIAEAGPQ